MTNETAIADIATIRTGYTFRKDHSRAGAHKYLGLQIGDVRDSSVVPVAKLSPVVWHRAGRAPQLAPGDVVLAAKGSHNRAALFDDPESLVIPSSQFLVLSVRDERTVKPEYLCWLLNYRQTQRRLAEFSAGTNIRSLSKKDVLDFTVAVPSLERQKKILGIQALQQKEQEALELLIRNREKMVDGMIQRILKGAV